jgi:hypothetical protein
MSLQTYEDVLSLLSGDVPALMWKDDRNPDEELKKLLAKLEKDYNIKGEPARGTLDAIYQYLNPPPMGDFQINGDKSNVKWTWQTARFQNTFPIVLTAGQQVEAAVQTMAQSGLRGDSEVSGFLNTSTGRVSTWIEIPMLDRKLSNVPISANLMFGNAQLPAMLAQTLFTLATTQWQVTIKDLSLSSNTVSPVFFGRRFMDRGRDRVEQVRRAMLFSKFMHPYVLGPTTAYNTTTNTGVSGGPEVTLPSGDTVVCRFDVGGTADFDCRWILDDSSSTTGVEPVLTAQILVGEAGQPLNDTFFSWRDFMAAPTVSVTGMKQISGIAAGVSAAGSPGPGGCWTNLFKRGTKIYITFVSGDSGTITLRPGLVGTAIYSPSEIKNLIDRQAGSIQNRIAS